MIGDEEFPPDVAAWLATTCPTCRRPRSAPGHTCSAPHIEQVRNNNLYWPTEPQEAS